MELKEWLGKDNIIGQDIWKKKYQYNNESLEEWFDRVSNGNKEVRDLIKEKKFLFGGRVLANRGIPNSGNYYNCFSAGYVPDDYEGILDIGKEIGVTFKSQGGQGISLSKIRPKGTPIGNNYYSDGIIGFMKLFNEITEQTSQGGARKGALMISLDIRHKEAEDFIKIKQNDEAITKANLSLEIDDVFMRAVEEYYKTGKEVVLHEEKNYSGHKIEYDIIPIKLYRKMMQGAYDWAEPGCLFTNKARNYNYLEFDNEYDIVTTNPCGEQPLKAKTCCNLGSLNLYEFVNNKFTTNATFNFNDFRKAISISSNALDDIIDENAERLPKYLSEYKNNAYNWRNIGLGVFNYAHMLMALGFKYGEPLALKFTEKLFSFMQKVAIECNIERARKKGAFPKSKPELIIQSEIFQKSGYNTNFIKDINFRNCSLLSIAPTGSIATMLGGSGGIEPEFQFSYKRKTDNLKESYEIDSKIVQDYRKIHSYGSLPDYFVSSSDINWKKRVDTQAIIQNYVDTAISSTINLHNKITLNEIEQLYLYAWKKGLKGITIYRDGCKREGILTTKNNFKKEEENKNELNLPQRGEIIKPNEKDCIGFKRKLMTGCGSLHCAVYFDINSGDLTEIYLSKGSTGGCHNFMVGLSRMISASARAGISVADIVDQLMSTGACSSYVARTKVKGDTSPGSCCPMAVGYAIKEMWEEFNGIGLQKPVVQAKKPVHVEPVKVKCPDCGGELSFEGGCNICRNCGYTKCD